MSASLDLGPGLDLSFLSTHDRQSTCANCRLHRKRCYYVDAKPVSNSAEDELVAAREEIDRLRELVKLLMQGATNSNGIDLLASASSSLLPSPSSSSEDALVDFPVLASPALPSTLLLSPPHSPYSDFTVNFPLLASAPTASFYTADSSTAAYPYTLPHQPTSIDIAPPPLPAVAISGLPSFQPLPPEVDPLLFCG
ncbi:hypothetical protein JCM11251_001498 [Rhodosporidiobolus azoricus]